jgi:hypothetical protein
MKARQILGLLMLFVLQREAKAHRLNEYLQSATISLGQDSIRLHLHLIAGSDIAYKVIKDIDPNGDGFISETEQQAYAHLVLQGLSLNIDERPALIRLTHWAFPLEDEIKKGIGDIQLHLVAALVPANVTHHLIFENHHQQAISVYLVNCLVPADTGISVTRQSRNYNQSLYTLDLTTVNAIDP